MPKFTIIVPMYNAVNTIETCYRSILNQKYKDYEVLFVDDGSDDDTVAFLSSLISEDESARIISLPHSNAGHCRNIGIEAAVGEYLAFCDADDYFAEDLLNVSLRRAEETGADIVGFNYWKVYDDGSEANGVGVDKRFVSADSDAFSCEDCPDFILSALAVTPWSKIVRRDFVLENGIRFDEITSTNDITFSSVCLAKAETISYVNNRLYYYRVGKGNQITGSKKKNIGNLIEAIGSTIRQVSECENYNTLKLGLWNYVVNNMIHSFIHYIYDWDNSESREFYDFFHDYFRNVEVPDDLACSYQNVDVRDYVSRNYRWYKVFRDRDYDCIRGLLDHELIYSFTSFPARIGLLKPTIDTIIAQSRQPDRFILWLADSQFPGKENELPDYLLEYVSRGLLEIRWCRDLKPHKKYFYAMKEFPDSIIVTFDDDLLYRAYSVEFLMLSYLENPKCVSTLRTHLMVRGMNGEILPYTYWPKEISAWVGVPSMQLCATNGAGSLFPPSILKKEYLVEETIERVCLTADDLWLKAVEVLSEVPVVQAERNKGLRYAPGTQEVSLFHQNVGENQNDVQMTHIREWIDGMFGEGHFSSKLFHSETGKDLSSFEDVYTAYSDNYRILHDKLQETYREKSETEALLQKTYREKSELNAKLQQTFDEKSELNAKLQQTYDEKSELNAKLQRTYDEKSELNAKLQKTYAEKSEINAKLQKTYREKSEINAELKKANEELKEVSARLKEYEDRDLRIIVGKVVNKLKQ